MEKTLDYERDYEKVLASMEYIPEAMRPKILKTFFIFMGFGFF